MPRGTLSSVVLAIFLVGCSQSNTTLKDCDNATQQSGYVKCVGWLSEYEAKYHWFENWTTADGSPIHDDGWSPLATFRISSPAIYAGRTVAVLYKYGGKDSPIPPPVSHRGKDFSFEVPVDFFTGKYKTINNIDIANFRAMP